MATSSPVRTATSHFAPRLAVAAGIHEVALNAAPLPPGDIGSSTVLPDENALALLEGMYELEPRGAVRGFIAGHSFLVVPLLMAHRFCLDATKGRARRFVLGWTRDPEEGDEGLTLEAVTDLSADQALSAMEQLDEDWWLDVDYRVRSLVTILVRPG